MNQTLAGKVAIVTGGSKGYGYGIAAALAQRGDAVWITGRDKAALARAGKALGVQGVAADVAVGKNWDKVVAKVLAVHPRIDILINNAGAGVKIAPLAEQTDQTIEESIAVNLTGMLLGCRRIAPLMARHKSGTIVNISSVCQHYSWPGWSVYSAAKAGMFAAAKCLYAELRPHGVRVTTVVPSWGATEFIGAAAVKGHPTGNPTVAAQCMQPEEMGTLIAQICELPPHLAMLEVTVLPLVQEIMPL